MKNYKNIIFFVLYLFIPVAAQTTLQEQYTSAEKLFTEERYFDAVTELKRLNFFDSEKHFAYKSNKLIAEAYKKGARFDDAVHFFTLAEINAKSKEELYSAKIEIIRVNILRRTTGRAVKLINELEKDPAYFNKKELTYWRGWAYIFEDSWKKASEEFSKIPERHELSKFCSEVAEKKYSVTFAKISSLIIPGSGQIYTGHYLSGFLSLGWNALFGYLTVNALINERIFDGLMIANFLWLRFYNGNRENSAKFAEEENLKITNKALDYLQFNFTGIKP